MIAYFCLMIYGLFAEAGLALLIGLFMFLKKKPLLGWVFTLASFAGFLLAIIVINYFPEKL